MQVVLDEPTNGKELGDRSCQLSGDRASTMLMLMWKPCSTWQSMEPARIYIGHLTPSSPSHGRAVLVITPVTNLGKLRFGGMKDLSFPKAHQEKGQIWRAGVQFGMWTSSCSPFCRGQSLP